MELLKTKKVSGEGGIRTHDTVARIQTFQACSFDHSDTSPILRSKYKLYEGIIQ